MTTKENQSAEDNPSAEKLPENKPDGPKNDGLKHQKTANRIQVVIAIILAVNALFLYCNLGSLRDQIELTQEQIKLTEVLNQPLCGVKEIKINEVKGTANRIKIYAVITNSGNYKAESAAIEWKFSQCEDLMGKQLCKEIEGLRSDPRAKTTITILPKQEFNYFLIDIPKENLDKRVAGYDRGLKIELTIKYNGMNYNPQQYSGTFLIIRVGAPNIYEATIQKSSIGEQQGEQRDSSKEKAIMSHDASGNVRLKE